MDAGGVLLKLRRSGMLAAEVLSLFVYGTLMRGQVAHHRVAADVRSAQTAWTIGGLVHLPAGYPALIPGPDRKVYGELFELEREALDAVDAYEGFVPEDPSGSLFVRELRMVTSAAGTCAPAWCYLMNVAPGDSVDPLDPRLAGAVAILDGRWPGNVGRD